MPGMQTSHDFNARWSKAICFYSLRLSACPEGGMLLMQIENTEQAATTKKKRASTKSMIHSITDEE